MTCEYELEGLCTLSAIDKHAACRFAKGDIIKECTATDDDLEEVEE
jgi:hypothetical protein